MKRQKNIARHLLGLLPALVGLMSSLALPGYCRTHHASYHAPIPLDRNVWTSSGPEGASILSLAIDRSNSGVIYAGTIAGVSKSTDGGATWNGFSTSLLNTNVSTIAIDPSNPSTIYAGTDAGVFKSTDGGASWSAINSGLPEYRYIRTLIIDPATPATIYTLTPGMTFKSTDGGASWSNISNGLSISALAIDPTTSATLYAAAQGMLFKSTDGGASWSKFSKRLFNLGYCDVLAVDRVNADTIYAGTSISLFKSTDGGKKWVTINDGLSRNVKTIAIDPGNPNTIYVVTFNGGAFKSINGGASWSALNTDLTNSLVYALAVDPDNTNTVYAGTYRGGVFRSSDGGANWSASNTGQRSINAYALAMTPSNADILYTVTNGGVFKSTNAGASWNKANAGIVNSSVANLAIDPGDPSTVYAGTSGSGVLKSTDGGASWSTNNGLPGTYIEALVFHRGEPNTVYAGTSAGLFKSANAGASWSMISNSLDVFGLLIDPSNPSTMYALSYDYWGDYSTVSKSTDGGVTWHISDAGLPFDAQAITIDPVLPSTLYVGTFRGVFKTTDGGAHWSANDAGLTTSVGALAIDSFNPDTIYAGTYGRGVFKSTDGGASWMPFNDGLTNLNITALTIDPSGTFLHAATSAGVFDYQFGESCLGSIFPTTQFFDAGGGARSVAVTAGGECSWTAASNVSWISITSASSGSGNGSVNYTVAANTDTGSRTGRLIVALRAFTITQAGLPVRITSASVIGKKLFINGENFDPGAMILLNGEEQVTKNDGDNPKTVLIGKKAGKKIQPGDKIQVRNPNGSHSQEITFTGIE